MHRLPWDALGVGKIIHMYSLGKLSLHKPQANIQMNQSKLQTVDSLVKVEHIFTGFLAIQVYHV